MKTTRTNTLALFLLPVLTVLSCSKDIPSNPQEMDFAAASFSVGIMEKRCYMDYTYVLPQDEPPVVTAWNTVTLRAESDDAAFNGVNVSSSDPSVVSVERTEDPAEYTIVYRSDGKADIRVWNAGEEKTFRIEAREAIELEGLLMKVNGRGPKAAFPVLSLTTIPPDGRRSATAVTWSTSATWTMTSPMRSRLSTLCRRTHHGG